jgi:hypothetical protein
MHDLDENMTVALADLSTWKRDENVGLCLCLCLRIARSYQSNRLSALKRDENVGLSLCLCSRITRSYQSNRFSPTSVVFKIRQ